MARDACVATEVAAVVVDLRATMTCCLVDDGPRTVKLQWGNFLEVEEHFRRLAGLPRAVHVETESFELNGKRIYVLHPAMTTPHLRPRINEAWRTLTGCIVRGPIMTFKFVEQHGQLFHVPYGPSVIADEAATGAWQPLAAMSRFADQMEFP